MIESRAEYVERTLQTGTFWKTSSEGEIVEILVKINYHGRSAYLAVLTGSHTGFQFPVVYDVDGFPLTEGANHLLSEIKSDGKVPLEM